MPESLLDSLTQKLMDYIQGNKGRPDPAQPSQPPVDSGSGDSRITSYIKDLYDKANQKVVPGLKGTLKTITDNPGKTALGATVGAGTDIAKYLGASVYGVSNAIYPYEPTTQKMLQSQGLLPDASALRSGNTTSALEPINAPKEFLPHLGERAYELLNSLPFIQGLPNALAKHYSEASATQVDDLKGRTLAGMEAIEKTVGDVALPELRDITQGQQIDPKTGQPIPQDPYKLGKDFTNLGIKALLLRKGLEGHGPDPIEAMEGAPQVNAHKTLSKGEMDAARETMDAKKVELGQALAAKSAEIRAAKAPIQPAEARPTINQEDGKPLMYSDSVSSENPTGVDLTAGVSPVPLDDRGLQVARDLAPNVTGLDRIYASDTVRGKQTADILSNMGGEMEPIPVVPEPGLKPLDTGVLTGLPTDEISPTLKQTISQEPGQALPSTNAEGGQSFNDWKDQTLGTFDRILTEHENSIPTPVIRDLLTPLKRSVKIGTEVSEHEDPRAQLFLKGMDKNSYLADNIDKIISDVGATNPKVIGAGFDHIAIDLGNDKVLKLGRLPEHTAESELILKPELSRNFKGLGVEIYPKVNTDNITKADLASVNQQLSNEGKDWLDGGIDNLGRDKSGKLKIIDGDVTNQNRGNDIPLRQVEPEVPQDVRNKLGIVTHSKNLALLQTWLDNGAPKDYAIDPAEYNAHTSGEPGSMYHISKGDDGNWQMSTSDKVEAPGVYAIRHGETTFDGPSEGSTEPTLGQTSGPSPQTPAQKNAQIVADLPQEIKDAIQTKSSMDIPLTQAIIHDAIMGGVQKDTVGTLIKQGTPAAEAVRQVLLDPKVTSPIINSLSERWPGTSPDQIRIAMSQFLQDDATYSGQNLQSFSEVVKGIQDDLTAKFQDARTIPEATEILKQLQRAKSIADGPLSGWTQASNTIRNAEHLRQGLLVSPIRTMLGIFESQAGLVGTDFMDAFNSGLANTYKGMTRGLINKSAPPPDINNWSDLLSLTSSVFSRLPGKIGDRATTDAVLDTLPLNKQRLMSGLLVDAEAGLSGQVGHLMAIASKNAKGGFLDSVGAAVKAVPGALDTVVNQEGQSPIQKAINAGTIVSDVLNIANRWQETEFRKIAFRSRLDSNLRQIPGAPQWGPELIQALTEKKFDPETKDVVPLHPALREAVVDAEQHALRQTYAYTPGGGLFGAYLKGTKQIPFATVIGPTFPRSMVNNMMWQMHHSPAFLGDMFTKEFRDTFYAVGSKDMGMVASRNASRKMGQAMTGMMMMNVAMHLTQGGSLDSADDPSKVVKVGPRPWLMQIGDEKDAQGNPKYLDISSYQPFVNIMDAMHMANEVLAGRKDPVPFMDVASHLTNSRIDQLPITGLDEIIKNFDSSNPDTVAAGSKSIAEFVGQYLGSWATPIRGLREEGQALKDAGSLATSGLKTNYQPQKYSQTQEGPLAPVVANIKPDILQKGYDTFRNKEQLQEHPLANLFKLETKPMTPLESLMLRTPGVNTSDLTKHYDNARADRLTKEATGQIINNPDLQIGGMQLQDFAKKLSSQNNPLKNALVLKQLLPAIHSAAEQLAMSKDATENHGIPVNFRTEIAKSASEGIPEIQQNLIKEILDATRKRAAGVP